MWHASVASMPDVRFGKRTLAHEARRALEGVGDTSLGEWEEWTGYAFHLRRRLSRSEEAVVGPVIDIRGTDEAGKRLGAVWRFVPDEYASWAREELEPRRSAGTLG